MEDQKAKEGDSVIKFSCKFTKPDAKYRWYKNKLEIFQGKRYHFENEGEDYELCINNIKMEDGGKYTLECDGIKTSAWLYVEGNICFCILYLLLVRGPPWLRE